MSELKLCRYELNFARSATLEGVFVVNEREWKALHLLSGSTIYYGEVAGKHSDVMRVFDINDVYLIEADQSKILWFAQEFGSIGFDFLSRWLDDDNAYDDGFYAAEKGLSLEEAIKQTHYIGEALDDFKSGFTDYDVE